MQEFLSVTHDVDEMLTILQKRLIKEHKLKYPDYVDSEYLVFAMQDIFMYTNHPFVILMTNGIVCSENISKIKMPRKNIWIS